MSADETESVAAVAAAAAAVATAISEDFPPPNTSVVGTASDIISPPITDDHDSNACPNIETTEIIDGSSPSPTIENHPVEQQEQLHRREEEQLPPPTPLPIPQVRAQLQVTTPMVPQDFGVSYFAVRRGKSGLRSSIFLNWKDCERFIDGYERAEYASFDKFEEAVTYLMASIEMQDSDMEEKSQEEYSGEVSRAKGNGTNGDVGVNLISPFGSARRGARVKAEANPNRKPTRAWEKMYQRFSEFAAAKNTTEVDTSKENVDLLRWTRQQQHEYRYLKEGKPSSMFQIKIDKLREIGFEFKYISMDERLSTLVKFKEKHGHYNVPPEHPTLGKWLDEQKKAAKKYAEEGDATDYFDNRIKELLSLGFKVDIEETTGEQEGQKETSNAVISADSQEDTSTTSFPTTANTVDQDKKWNKHFEELVEYKNKKGNCDVPPSQHTPLSYWVTQQHKEYQKLQEGKPTRLTLQKMQQLTDLGFIFRTVSKSLTWDQRIEQLKQYKILHGHTRVPKSDPQLGVFVNRQRYEYSKFKSGRPSTMNESRLNDLQELDFVFVAGKKMSHVNFKNKKSWDERFEELLQFKATYNHAVVPQSFPGLGEWVHSQRLYYKKLKAGKKSPLTSERLLRLADVGFVFDATKRRGNHVNDIASSMEIEGPTEQHSETATAVQREITDPHPVMNPAEVAPPLDGMPTVGQPMPVDMTLHSDLPTDTEPMPTDMPLPTETMQCVGSPSTDIMHSVASPHTEHMPLANDHLHDEHSMESMHV